MDKPPITSALDTPQVARAGLKRFEMELCVTPLGLLAVGVLVAGILLAIPPIIRAGGDAARA